MRTPYVPATPSRRALRALALCIVLVLVAPILAPAAQAASLAIDLRQRIDVLHTSDPEAVYVADAVRDFADGADANARIAQIDDADAFMDALRASNAAILIVAAHGSSDLVGPGSGILVGGERITRDEILSAIGASGAKRFYFASCGLGLPEEVGGRPVHSFSVPIDKKLAAVEALSEIGYIYQLQNQERLAHDFELAVMRIGSVEELFVRWLMPVEPLRPDDGGGYDCYYHDSSGACDWDRIEEERLQETAQREGGGFAAPAPEFSQALQWLIDMGLVKMAGAGEYKYDIRWAFLIELDFECKILFDVMDLVVPGYSQALDHLPEIKGIDFDLSVLRVEICGDVYFGMAESGGPAGGGSLRLQVGSTKEIKFKFGFVHIAFSFWIGVVIEATGAAEDASGGNLEYIRWNLQLSIYFLIDGSWGWGSGTVRFDFLTPPWQRGDTFRNPFYQGAAAAAMPGIELPATPDVSVAGVPVLQDAVTDYLILPLSQPAVNAIKRSPELAERLSAATGTDATKLPVGTLLNLGNPNVYRAIYGDRLADTAARTRIPDPIVAPNVVSPLAVDGCRAVLDPEPTAEPRIGGAAVEACPTASTEEIALAAGASAGGADVDGILLDTPATAWWEETYDIGPMRACRAVQQPTSKVCQDLALALAAHSLVKSRGDGGTKASIKVRFDVNNAAAFIDMCAGMGLTPACTQGTAGMGGIALAEDGVPIAGFDSVETYHSLYAPGGAVDSRATTALQAFGPTTLHQDVVCFYDGLNDANEDVNCGDL